MLANEPVVALKPRPVKGMRLAVPTTIALDDLDADVAKTFERALKSLADHGAIIERIAMAEFHDIGPMNAKGGFAASESFAWHRYLITSKGDVYDPRVFRPHHARRGAERGRLHRSPQRAPFADRPRQCAHRAL
ncbi:Asp-tRNA(Asn)/Glu-tRNA(Gln) amidotransferase A subunit family amidase [Bradyrhizobium sp. LM3.2]